MKELLSNMEILLPQPETPDIYTYDFDKQLYRIPLEEETNPLVGSTEISNLSATGYLSGLSTEVIASAINEDGNIITDIINDNLDTQAAEILGEFTFGVSGAIAMKNDDDNGLWLSPTGILGKKSGNNTFTITTSGDATFAGTLAAAAGTLGSITAGSFTGITIAVGSSNNIFKVDANGIYLGHATYGSAPFKVSMAGNLIASNLTATGGTIAGLVITAGTIRTSSGTTRVEMADNNTLKVYETGTTRLILGSGAISSYDSSGNFSAIIHGAGVNTFGITLTNYAYYFNEIGFMPSASGALDLGVSGNKFKDLYLTGSITVGGTVDGIDIAAHDGGAITTYHSGVIDNTMHGSKTGIASSHHSSTSSGIAIVPSTISTNGSCTVGTLGSYTHLPRSNVQYNSGSSSYYWAGVFARSIFFTTGLTVNPSFSGQMRYYDAGGGGFRGNIDGWLGQFDLTAK